MNAPDRPLRIAIDATAMPAQRAGAGTYTYELVRALSRTDLRNRYVVFARPGAFEGVERPGFRVASALGGRLMGGRPFRTLWEQTALPARLRGQGVDVFHSPHHTLPALTPGVARVTTVHDVTFELLPERYPMLRRRYMQLGTRLAASVADRIIVPSESTARDLRVVLPRLRAPIDVVPEAAAAHFFEAPAEAELAAARVRHRLPERFILNVGTIEPGKNQRAIVRALAWLAVWGLPHHLVIAGQRGWLYDDLLRLIDELGLRDRVHFAGYVPHEDLRALYCLANVFVFPSLHEGFGLPPLEAMACGTPVVVSRTSAMPEVVGDAGLLVDPADDETLARAIRTLAEDDEARADYARRGRERAASFSWDETARRTVETYERAAGRGGTA